MRSKSIIEQKSLVFALRIIKAFRFLKEQKGEYIMSKQLLRSGTAIGALIREAEFAESKKDFIHKLHISLKEANETDYWLTLLHESKQHVFRRIRKNKLGGDDRSHLLQNRIRCVAGTRKTTLWHWFHLLPKNTWNQWHT